MSRRVAVLASLALFTAAPALAQTADDPVADEIVGGWPSLTPGVPQIQAALDTVDPCKPGTVPACTPRISFVVHGATCKPSTRIEGHHSAVCRVDWTTTEPLLPERQVQRDRDACARFVMLPGGVWGNARTGDGPCEVPSTLKRDPHPRPTRADLEEEAVGAAQCYDGETSDCFNYSKSAKVTGSRCRPQPEREAGKPRFVCLITGTVFYTSARPQRFTDLCIRITRYSAPGESPPFWGTDFNENDPECEVDWKARR